MATCSQLFGFCFFPRYNLDPFKGHRASTPEEPQDTLGPEQWLWFEQQLQAAKRTADVILIGSGIQVGAVRPDVLLRFDLSSKAHFPCISAPSFMPFHLSLSLSPLQILSNNKFSLGEGYAKHRASLAKFLSILAKVQAPRVLLLSGDIHMAEITTAKCRMLYPLYELTSSGMTHSWAGIRENVVKLVTGTYGLLGRFTGRNVGEVALVRSAGSPQKHSVSGSSSGNDGGELLAIFRIFDQYGQEQLQHTIALDELQPQPIPADLQADIAACAASDPHKGLTPACTRVLESCDHNPNAKERDSELTRIALAAALLSSILGILFGSPILALFWRPKNGWLCLMWLQTWLVIATVILKIYLDE